MKATEFVRNLGLGWNLGNTFDAFPLHGERDKALAEGKKWTAADQEQLWNNVPVTAEQMKNIAHAGFRTIRIPVTWRDFMAADGSAAPDFLDAVAQAVDDALAANLFVIINVHHDGSAGESLWIRHAGDYAAGLANQDCQEEVFTRFENLWKSIATRFASYDDRLIFEGGNEIRFPQAPEDANYALLNRLNQLFVDTVRVSNPTRFLLIPGMETDTCRTADPRFHMPKDSVAERMALSIHYYSPAEFALADDNTTWAKPVSFWGSMSERDAMRKDFAVHKEKFTSRGIPIILGEFGTLTLDEAHKDHESMLAWHESVLCNALNNGECPILWDTSTKEMNYVNRQTGEFYDPDVKRVFEHATQCWLKKNPGLASPQEQAKHGILRAGLRGVTI